jgi:ActR/RegA family two-component response regulator
MGRVRDHVVVVEDNDVTLRKLVKIAERKRFRVLRATSILQAEAALAAIDLASIAGGVFDLRLGGGATSFPLIGRVMRASPRALIAVCTGYRGLYAEELDRLGLEVLDKPCDWSRFNDFFRRVAASSADGQLSIADAVELVSRYREMSAPMTRIIAAFASGTPRAQLPAATGIPEKTIQGYLRGSTADALLALVLRVAHDGPAELLAETEGAALS